MRFQERIHLQKSRLDQIQNGRLSAIIHFHMEAQSIKQNVTFQEGCILNFFLLDQIQNGRLSAIIHFDTEAQSINKM